MRDFTPSQLREHLSWLYRQPKYYKKDKELIFDEKEQAKYPKCVQNKARNVDT
jgi:hypothetical protein|tara:strand:- start:274 stop:432 length:159 start_codon:yes stop_codon:yes gene_type:complete